MVLAHYSTDKLLGDLIDGLQAPWAQLPVSGLQLDSRAVRTGDVFLACQGHAVDGREFINDALAKGAAAILVQRGDSWQENEERAGIPLLVVDKLPAQISAIAGRFYGHPSRQLPVIGVTGTNGKTSTTQLIMQLVNGLRHHCGVIGTLGSGVDGDFDTAVNTTPDAISVHRYLSEWQQQGVDVVAMEVSSHGIEQHRVAAVEFDIALFTNLSRDHLDYHGTMAAYGNAKKKLFEFAGLQTAIVNFDDDYASDILSVIDPSVTVLTYSLENENADVYVDHLMYGSAGIEARCQTPWGSLPISCKLLGSFNLSNVLAAVTVMVAAGYKLADVLAAVPSLNPIPGRMELVAVESDIEVIIDYAHTPDALEKALKALRYHTRGDVWCVFGCGGDRDAGKRAPMGTVADNCADQIVVTSDNPRHESAQSIIDDIVRGIAQKQPVINSDRASAIALSISRAQPGDCVLIAGKGHEDYQQVGDERLPFSDIEQAKNALLDRNRQGVQ